MKKEVDRNKDSTKDVNSEVSLEDKRRFRFRSKGMYAIVAVFVVIAIITTVPKTNKLDIRK